MTETDAPWTGTPGTDAPGSGATGPRASGTSPDPVLVIDDLRVERGGRRILHGIDLTVGERGGAGEVVGLLGPSGGGKTTLMRAVVGVQARVSGSVRVLGEPAGSPRVRGRVGYVTQAPAIYDDLTAGENLEFFAALLPDGAAGRSSRGRRGRVQERVDRALQTVGLGDARDQVVRTMSGGQRSRVSLATALLGDPALLVLDEPTVGLDPVLRRDLWATFRALAAAGTAILVSSHVMDEADRCDRIALLREGHLLAAGPPGELRERTGTTSVEDAFLALIDTDTTTGGRS